MAEAPFSPMAAPPPLREASPAMPPGRLEAMQRVHDAQKGAAPTSMAKEIGEKILEMIQATPQHREKLTQALRLVTEVATDSLKGMQGATPGMTAPPPMPGADIGGAPMVPPGMMSHPPNEG